MASEQETREQLMLLRDITRRTGVIHDAQRFQLMLWPRVALEHCVSSEVEPKVEFDAEGKVTSRVVYVRATVKGKDPQNLDRRLDMLKAWIAALLGAEWTVDITLVRPKKKGPRVTPARKKRVKR